VRCLNTVSIFSGGGGLDLGLEAAGFSTLFATDIDYHSIRTLERGKEESQRRGQPFFKDTVMVEADIKDINPEWILREIGRAPGEVDLLAGGPPCQAFSVFGRRRGIADPRGQLIYEYLRILSAIRPKAFILENVYGIMTVSEGKLFQEFVERIANPLDGLHYEMSIHRLNAVNYGVPQLRDRVFIIGHLDGGKVVSIPSITEDDDQGRLLGNDILLCRTVRDAFRGLPKSGANYPENHVGRRHSRRIIERYRGLAPGQRDPYTRINKLDLNRPSFTIVVGSDKGGGKGHIHPVEPREVTPRESARIQTFPDWWAFSGTSRHPIRQIGNAVPPLWAGVIGNEIAVQLFGMQRRSLTELVESLGQNHLFEGELRYERLSS
jgi:DNA (cytosine-5)-methyltransferase 1